MPGSLTPSDHEASPPDEGAREGVTGLLAAVVTFHPGPELAQNLAALRAQAGAVLVIDNGSPNFARIEQAAAQAGCRAIGLGVNLGIAAALNRAAMIARAEGFSWLATFDQDSLAPSGALLGLLDLCQAHPDRDRVAVVAMSHRDRVAGRDYHMAFDVIEETPLWRSVRTTITSGSLVRLAALDQVGSFDEILFIDCVDHDFCLRCRHKGWLVVEAKRHVMAHSLGAVTLHRLLWREVACTNHSPTRRYYMTRNTLEVCARNLTTDFLWSMHTALHFAGASVAMLIFERDRPAKIGAMIEGVFDFCRRRFGPRPIRRRQARIT
jgi:rhamnosyltransferase